MTWLHKFFGLFFIPANGRAKSAQQLISTMLPFHPLYFPWKLVRLTFKNACQVITRLLVYQLSDLQVGSRFHFDSAFLFWLKKFFFYFLKFCMKQNGCLRRAGRSLILSMWQAYCGFHQIPWIHRTPIDKDFKPCNCAYIIVG